MDTASEHITVDVPWIKKTHGCFFPPRGVKTKDDQIIQFVKSTCGIPIPYFATQQPIPGWDHYAVATTAFFGHALVGVHGCRVVGCDSILKEKSVSDRS